MFISDSNYEKSKSFLKTSEKTLEIENSSFFFFFLYTLRIYYRHLLIYLLLIYFKIWYSLRFNDKKKNIGGNDDNNCIKDKLKESR